MPRPATKPPNRAAPRSTGALRAWAVGGGCAVQRSARAGRCCATLCGVRCSAVWCGAVLCCAVLCGAVRCGAVRCGAVLCGAVRCGAVRCRAVPCGGAEGRRRTLMSETARQPLAMPVIWGQIRPRNCHEVCSTEHRSTAAGGRCRRTGGSGTLGRAGERHPRHLVRQHKDEQGGTLNRVRQVGVGDHVVRELDALPNREPTT